MPPSSFAMVLGVVNALFLLGLIVIGVLGIVRTSGRTRSLVTGGFGALVLARVVGVVSAMFGPLSSDQQTFFMIQIAVNVITGLLTLAGIALLVFAAVQASTASAPHYPGAAYPPYPGPGQPGGWQ